MTLNFTERDEGVRGLPWIALHGSERRYLSSDFLGGIVELAFHEQEVGMLDVRILIFNSFGFVGHLPALAVELIAGLEVATPGFNVGNVGDGGGGIDAIVD